MTALLSRMLLAVLVTAVAAIAAYFVSVSLIGAPRTAAMQAAALVAVSCAAPALVGFFVAVVRARGATRDSGDSSTASGPHVVHAITAIVVSLALIGFGFARLVEDHWMGLAAISMGVLIPGLWVRRFVRIEASD